jgi:hypothetical protein
MMATLLSSSSQQKKTKYFKKRGEGKSLPFATMLKIQSSSCVAPKFVLRS